MFCKRELGRGIGLHTTMALEVFGLKVGKDKCIKIDPVVAELPRTLRGHLHNRVRALCSDRFTQKLLEIEAPRHSHLKEVTLALAADGKADGACRRHFKPRLLKHRADKLHGS